MRVLVCGDRNWTDQDLVDSTLDTIHAETPISCIIEGEARGADKAGRSWAERRGVSFMPFPANWAKFGKAAGPIRNRQQFKEGEPDLGVAFHDDLEHSRGTKDMVGVLEAAGIPVRKVSH
jgi:hypothetical protein